MFGLPLLIAVTLPFRDEFALSTELLLVLVVVLAIAALGGMVVGTVAAIVASLLLNWFFVEPYSTLTIGDTENFISLVVFIVVAITTGALVDTISRRSLEARRARREAEELVRSTTSLAIDPEPVQRLIEQIQSAFDLAGVRLDAEHATGTWSTLAMAGDVTDSPTATLSLPNGTSRDDEHTLELYGRSLSPDDQRLLRALADQLGLAIENQILESEAAEAATLADVDVVRTALLRAVSHDLRTPLASIKAMISGLRDPTVAWTPEETAEALLTVDEETDRLNVLVSNLLDASRLQIGALAIDVRPAEVDEIVAAAIHSIGAPNASILVDVPEDLPAVSCDSTLLERSLANVISNALRFSPPDTPVRIEAAEVGQRVHLRVIDRGIGIKPGRSFPSDPALSTVRRHPRRQRCRVGTVDRRGVRRCDGRRADARRHAGRRSHGDDHLGGGPRVERAMTSILVVDDERQIRRALGLNFRARGYVVTEAASGEAALTQVADHRPDIVLLDLGLPGIDGIAVIDALRGWTNVPIIVLTAREDERSKVLALEAGADDYVTKPFGMAELVARVRAALRRSSDSSMEAAVVSTPDFTLDLAAHRAFVGPPPDTDRTEVRLTPTEWGIVGHLVRNPHRLVTYTQLLVAVWGPDYEPDQNLLRVHMGHIRRKLEPDHTRPRYFITDAGVGYRFQPGDVDAVPGTT